MKNILSILLFFVMLNSCSSTEDEDLTNLNVIGSIDTTSLASLSGNDATALVTLNGEAAANFTSLAAIGDEISYTINTTNSNVEIVILDFFYTSGDRELWENGIEVIVDRQSSPSIASLKIIDGIVGNEVKFGFTFALKTNGVLDANTTYIVDPKIRVRS